MVGGFFGTNVGAFPRILGVEGWRLAFYFVALVSVATSGLVYRHALDPRRKVQPWPAARLPHPLPVRGRPHSCCRHCLRS